VADADVISAFWFGTMCHTLVYELNRDQLSTTMELLDITTRHASGEEAVGAAFSPSDGKAAAGGGYSKAFKATIKSARKGAKGGKKGKK
jgi:hypothetical protein